MYVSLSKEQSFNWKVRPKVKVEQSDAQAILEQERQVEAEAKQIPHSFL